MPTYTQSHTYLAVTTPLGKDALLLRELHGEERISGLFDYTLEMLATDKSLSFDAIVGKRATVRMGLAGGATRYVNGVVGRFYQAGTDRRFTTYYAELHPWLWLLTLTSDSRIFQQMTTPQIITRVFDDLGQHDYKLALSGTYSPREYCVQYQETAFAFVSRLMEDEGIFYFFEHQDGKHTLVLADDASAYPRAAGLDEAVRYQSALVGATQADTITACTFEQQMVIDQYSVADFNFETPATHLLDNAPDSGTHSLYEYPGNFGKQDVGQRKARARLESHEAPKTLLRGESVTPAFSPGHTFSVVGHDRDAANTSYVVLQVAHQANTDDYVNSFMAMPSATPFRPLRQTPWPRIHGTQTAIVVGKAGEEIWTDQYARVKVQFHWDRRGKKDENSSCWIRVAQGWAGKAWGSIFIPRIGQEVVVSFLEGDPDRPLITGTVYNAQQTVPYALPGAQTRSTIKSSSSKGGAGYNELCFEDKAGSEEIYIHAQKDMTTIVEHDRSATIKEGNDTLLVEKGKRDVTVAGDETHTNKANFTQKVAGNYTLNVDGNLTIDVTGSITIKAGQSFTNKAGMNLESSAGMNLTNKAGMSLTNEAELSLTSKGNASQTVESSGVVTIQGALVKIN